MINVLVKGDKEQIEELKELKEEMIYSGIYLDLNETVGKSYEYIILIETDKPFLQEKYYVNKCKRLYMGVNSYVSENNKVETFLNPLNNLVIKTILNKIINERNLSSKIAINKEMLKDIKFNNVCNLYIKLSEAKYIKIFSKEVGFCYKDVGRYDTKGINLFYVDIEDYGQLLKEISKQSSNKANSVLNKMIISYGISENTIQLLQEYTKEIIKDVKNNSLEYLISKLFEDSPNYDFSYNHTYVLSLYLIAIGIRFNIDEEDIVRLVIASYLHDIVLEDKKLIYIHDLQKDVIENLPDKDIEKIKNHSKSLAEMLKFMHPDEKLINIIRNSHTEPFQIFYDNKPYKDLDQLSEMFIVSHSFVSQLFKVGFSMEKKEYIRLVLLDEFKKHKYSKKIINNLSDIQ